MPSKQTPPKPSDFRNEPPDPSGQEKYKAILTDADVWGNHFAASFQDAFLLEASKLPHDVGEESFRQAALKAFIGVLVESGATQLETTRLLNEAVVKFSPLDPSVEWTHVENTRRLELIDKKIQQKLSPDEAAELEHLTARLRVHFDTEEMIPLEGARRLHEQLLNIDKSKRAPS